MPELDHVKTPLAAAAPGMLLATAALVSIGAHTLLVTGAKDQSLGQLTNRDLPTPPVPMQVKSAPDDLGQYMQQLAREDPGQAPDADLETLQDTLNATPDPTVPDFADEPEPELIVYEPDLLEPTLVDLPQPEIVSNLNDDLLAALDAVELPGLALNDLPPIDPGAGLDAGTGGAPPAGPGSATGNAANLLANAGVGRGAGGTTNPGPALGPPPPALAPPPLLTPGDTTGLSDLELPPIGSPSDALAPLTTDDLVLPIQLDHAFNYDVHRFRDNTGGYFRVRIQPRPRELQVLQPMNKDVVWLIDTSSSISNRVVDAAAQGVSRSLDTLNPGDRFNIVLFNDQARALATGLLDANDDNRAAARRFVNAAESDGSFTDVNGVILDFLQRTDRDPNRVLNLVVISDGKPTTGTTDARALINQITAQNDRVASIFCVGVTDEPNSFLLDYLSYRNGGKTVFATRSRDVANAIATLASETRYPLIRDVSLKVLGAGAREVHPIRLADIYLGQGFDIFGRYDTEGPFTIRIAGNGRRDQHVQPVDFTFVRDLSNAPDGARSIATSWSFWKLHHLYAEQIQRGNDPALLEEIRQLERARR